MPSRFTDEDALLRAVWDAPHDDAPRLVYADWLDEHGDPDRAQFVRLQCELARLDHLATEFVKHGWSIKSMHRLIMLSATYQQSASNLKSEIGNRQS